MTLVGVFDHLRHIVTGDPDRNGVYTVRCGKMFLRTFRKAGRGTFVECPRCSA